MLKRIAVAAAVLAAAFGPAGAAQDDPAAMTLTFKQPSFKLRRPVLVLNGTAALPDGVILKVNLARMSEQAVRGELTSVPVGGGSGSAEVLGKKFFYEATIDGPAKYNVSIAILDDLQDKHIATELKKKAGMKRQWNFEYLVWGDDLVPMISSKLPDLAALVQDCRELLEKFEKASASKASWDVNMKPLAAEGHKLHQKLNNSDLKAYFPGSVHNLAYTVINFVGSAPYYIYGADGKFAGAKDYHTDNQKVKTFQGEEFDWPTFRRYIESTPALGGREFCLWIVKELRRTAGQMRPEIQDALKTHRAAPGVDMFQERLGKATIADLDVLEVQIRGTKPSAPASDGGAQKQ